MFMIINFTKQLFDTLNKYYCSFNPMFQSVKYKFLICIEIFLLKIESHTTKYFCTVDYENKNKWFMCNCYLKFKFYFMIKNDFNQQFNGEINFNDLYRI